MSRTLEPASIDELAAALGSCGAEKTSVELGGCFSKRGMGGPVVAAGVIVSSRRLNHVLAYEPADLTISVEAGISISELNKTLAANRQCLPLDPPYTANATIGGVLATNGSGPRRRRYGTARDMVIGMTFVTMEGKQITSGGMVVKNVAGLDMAKLLIGSYGTLAAIGSVNFKVFPEPEQEQTFVMTSPSLDRLLDLRQSILRSVLQPVAIDLLNPQAVQSLALPLPAAYALLLETSGNEATVGRYAREYEALARSANTVEFLRLDGKTGDSSWRAVREFAAQEDGITPRWTVRVSITPARLGEIFRAVDNGASTPPVVARAAAGVAYLAAAGADEPACLAKLRSAGCKVTVESAPAGARQQANLWSPPGPAFEVMKRIKHALDPDGLLNRGRLFNRI